MIQRIQSLFLLIVIICLGCMIMFPLASFSGENTTDVLWTAKGFEAQESHALSAILPAPMMWPILALMAITTFILFSYKDRKRQMMLGRINYFLILGLMILIFMSVNTTIPESDPELGLASPGQYGIGTYLALGALGLQLLANRAIKKDEDLVNSTERLR